ncbi:lysophospholipid acyltransferase family protein [Streptomyces sp. NPDC001340]
MTVAYRCARNFVRPFIQGYGRLTCTGADVIPLHGPVLLVANHDSPLDALVLGVAARRQREVRFLTKKSLWKHEPLGRVLNSLGQIPIERGAQNENGLGAAVAALDGGDCVCVFPEGTLSRGRRLRVRSGAARLLSAVPEAALVGCAITGAVDLRRLRPRAHVRVVFFDARPGMSGTTVGPPASVVEDAMERVRTLAPPAC